MLGIVFVVLGRTAQGRYLKVFYQAKEFNVFRPFTGWEMSLNERNIYDRQVREN